MCNCSEKLYHKSLYPIILVALREISTPISITNIIDYILTDYFDEPFELNNRERKNFRHRIRIIIRNLSDAEIITVEKRKTTKKTDEIIITKINKIC